MKDLHTLDQYRDVSTELRLYGMSTRGEVGKGNGVFKVFVNGKSFFVIASNGGGWDHVSVSRKNKMPTWDEMCAIKDMFFEPEEVAVQYHPKKSEYVNNHPYCLHLWRPNCGQALATPPKLYV